MELVEASERVGLYGAEIETLPKRQRIGGKIEKLATAGFDMSDVTSAEGNPSSQRRVLFLDFDGVMHRFGAVRTRRGVVSTSPSIELFEFAHVLVECLEPYPGVQVVLSTSWVRALGYQRARCALPPELRERVVGATYHSKFYDAPMWPIIRRGTQILRYVWTHRLTRWLAVDDEVDGLDEYLSHVVRCDERLGLGDVATRTLLEVRLAEQFQ